MRTVKRASAVYVAALIAVGIIAGSLIRPIAEKLDGSTPRPGWGAAIVLAACAAIVGALARAAWVALHRRSRRMSSDYAVRLLAIAKAGIAVGSLFGGLYLGLALAFIRDLDTELGLERFLQGGAAGLAGIALLTVGLLLERALTLPGDDDEDEKTSTSPA